MWPPSNTLEAAAGRVRLVNSSSYPKLLAKNDHFCQARLLSVSEPEIRDTNPQYINQHTRAHTSSNSFHSESINLDSDNILTLEQKTSFQQVLQDYDHVFDKHISCYNGASGPFEAVVNMGPVQPPQRKGRLPQYARDRLCGLQAKFDELESEEMKDDWCYIRKFSGSQLRSASYKVNLNECYKVPSYVVPNIVHRKDDNDSDEEADVPDVTPQSVMIDPPYIPPEAPPEITLPEEPSVDSTVAPSTSLQRPKRLRKLPKYLNDYDLSY
ncbi:hypothetical protein LOTGIDRAFT_153921 [Lottia gigantea]|uniref:Uncharacterized protein n=1 Tax=Lottia gigantea TaxID=225164 RepID=V4A465_LOTGI|nr:hypothetical protein LOTGIDRAFT_153921 [Lottia gigantea]ESO91477.1 hypothetical protein LOTGIDRAFT_153921 [Lottia gigantea]